MTKEVFEQLTKVLVSEDFDAKIDSCGSMEDLSAKLKESGVDVTADELQYYFECMKEPKSDDGTLNEDDLEMVSGGGLIGNWFRNAINDIKNSFEYYLGGQYILDIASGKRKHPWIN
jgi:hypothetical protein